MNNNKIYFTGYASVFNNKDDKGDIVLPSAFDETNLNPKNIKLLYNHDQNLVIGNLESIRKDSKGIYIKASISPKNPLEHRLATCLINNMLSGLSIGYIAKSTTRDSLFNRRYINKLDLKEISIVQKPSNPQTIILHKITNL
jgi:HK97 family phage prohead protease